MKAKRASKCSGKGKGAKGLCDKAKPPKHKSTDFRRTPMSAFKAKPKGKKAPAGRKR